MKLLLNEKYYYQFSDIGLEVVTLGGGKKERKNVRFLGNFIPIVLKKFNVVQSGEASVFLKVQNKFSDGLEGETFEISLEKLDQIRWTEEVDEHCLLNPEISRVREHIASVICLQSSQMEITDGSAFVVERFGGHKVDDTFVFHVGDRLIWPSQMKEEERPKVIFIPENQKRLVVDNTYLEQQADAEMAKIVELCPEVGAVILALNLACLQWQAFEDAGVTPRCSIFLYGETGTKKTTYASFVNQLFNRDLPLERPERFNASVPAMLDIMKNIRHWTQLIDDLYPAGDSEMRRHQEKTLLEILRVVADGVDPARIRGGKVLKNPPLCGLLLTGEYYVGKGSDAARMIPIEIKNPIDSGEFSYCQKKPLALSTFYNFYLQWFVDNYSEIVENLVEERRKYLMYADKNQYHARLKEMQFCLGTAYKVYLVYRVEKEFMTTEEMYEACKNFNSHLSSMIALQDYRVKNGNLPFDNLTVDYLNLIKTMVRKHEFVIVGNPSEFDVLKHDAVLYNNYLYFRKDKLVEKMGKYESAAEFKDVVRYLDACQVLKKGETNISVQLHNAGKGLRFYAIRWDALNK